MTIIFLSLQDGFGFVVDEGDGSTNHIKKPQNLRVTIGNDVEIGPYCVIGDEVQIGARSHLHSHLVLEGPVTIGEDNEFYPFSSIGARSQDLKYSGEPTYAQIGNRNTFR